MTGVLLAAQATGDKPWAIALALVAAVCLLGAAWLVIKIANPEEGDDDDRE